MAADRPWPVLIHSPIGDLGIQLLDAARVARIDFLGTQGQVERGADTAIARLLRDYFRHPGASLDFALSPAPTVFQHRFREALRQVPAGNTVTYGDLARDLKTSPRALAQACRANPVPLLVPCHRVVAHDGIGGFSGKREGWSLAIKRWLLAHEGVAAYSEGIDASADLTVLPPLTGT